MGEGGVWKKKRRILMSDPQQPIWNGDDAAATGHRPDVTRRIFPKLTIYSGEHARLAPRFRFFRGPAPFPDRDWEASSTMVRLLATARRPTDKLIRLPDLRSIRKKKRPFWIEPFFLFFSGHFHADSPGRLTWIQSGFIARLGEPKNR